MMSESGLQWFACCTEPRHERAVTRMLQRQRIEHYLPMIPRARRWTDRSKVIQWPLFEGYVFVRIGAPHLWQVRATSGVRYVVRRGTEPAVVKDSEIENVRRVVWAIQSTGATPIEDDGTEDAPAPCIAGHVVRVMDGPFEGVEGIVRERRGRRRLLVIVDSLGATVALDVDARVVSGRGDAP